MSRAGSTSSLGRLIAVLVAVLALAVAGVVTTVVLLVRGDGDAGSAPTARATAAQEPAPVTLDDLAAGPPLVVARAGFCDRVDPAAAARALDGEVATADSYANGDRVELAPGVEDVAHENGCRWSGADGSVARAWVFAPPVTSGRARRLVAQADRGAGCATYDASAFGDPSVAWSCAGDTTTSATAGHAGLFGDAWLSCTVQAGTADGAAEEAADPAALQARADAWCAAVASGAAEG